LDDVSLIDRNGFESASARLANKARVDTRVADTFSRFSAAELDRRLQRAGTAFGHVNDLAGLARHPALRRTEVEVPGGRASMVSPAATFDGVSASLGAVPDLGADSARIRAEFEGMNA
jgi:itaconate CoA-transferase